MQRSLISLISPLVLLVSALGLGSAPAAAQSVGSWTQAELPKLTPDQPAEGDGFGRVLDVDGERAISNASAQVPAAVVVLGRDPGTGEWTQEALLPAPAGGIGFGRTAALSGDVVVVGAPADPAAGAAYVFEHGPTGWVPTGTLVAPGGQWYDEFATSLDVSGSVIAVGAPQDDHGRAGGSEFGGGSVHLFERVGGTWTQTQHLTESGTQPGFPVFGAAFGRALALQGDTLVVGAPDAHPGGWISSPGRAYVYQRDPQSGSWSLVDTVQPLASKPSDWFAGSAALDGELLALGAPHWDLPGAVWIFRRGPSGWTELATLVAPNGEEHDDFGASLFLRGSTLVAGAPRLDGAGIPFAGQAHVFERDQGGPDAWGLVASLTASDAAWNDQFGTAVALIDGDVLVGSPGDDLGVSQLVEVEALAVDPASGTWYGMDDGLDKLVTVDPVEGWGTLATYYSSWKNVQGMAFDSGTGTLYACDAGGDLLTVDLVNFVGQLALVGPTGFPGILSLAFDSSSNALYGVQTSTRTLVRIDPSSGAGTAVGVLAFKNIAGLAYDPTAGKLLASDLFSDQLIRVDPDTAQTSVVGPLIVPNVQALACDPVSGRLLGVANKPTDELVEIDRQTGAATVIGPMSGTISLGALYPYELDFPPAAYCTAGVSASGCQASISASGEASASASAGFLLQATGVEGDKSGQFFYGVNGIQASPWGNGTSLQCVVPPTVRAGVLQKSGTAGTCAGSFAQDLNALWAAKPAKSPGVGAFVQAQLWYRDPASTSNQSTSLSDALEFHVGP